MFVRARHPPNGERVRLPIHHLCPDSDGSRKFHAQVLSHPPRSDQRGPRSTGLSRAKRWRCPPKHWAQPSEAMAMSAKRRWWRGSGLAARRRRRGTRGRPRSPRPPLSSQERAKRVIGAGEWTRRSKAAARTRRWPRSPRPPLSGQERAKRVIGAGEWTRRSKAAARNARPAEKPEAPLEQPRTSEASDWCERGDSNPHGIATASPSSWCVCQFRHFREEGGHPGSPHRGGAPEAEPAF